MKPIWVVFKKEVLDNLRDRRSISSALLTPLFSPAFLVVFIIVLGKSLFGDPIETVLRLPVSGAENAPGLVSFLEENNVELLAAPEDPESAVREGEVEAVLIISEDYGEAFLAGEPAPVWLVVDTSRQASLDFIQRVRTLLYTYSQTIGSVRLLARGVNPALLNAISVGQMDVSTPQSQTLVFLNMMPFMLIVTICVGGMYVIIDATAGERERGSLEPLLINPVRRRDFVLGKLLASLPFAILTLVLAMVFFGAMFNLVPLEEFTGMPMQIEIPALWTVFWLLLPLVLLASSIQMVVATFTKSFKEAQTYLGLVPLVLASPGAFVGFLSTKATPGMMLIPSYSQSVLVNAVLRGETVRPDLFWISIGATLVVSAVLIFVAIRLFEREQVLYGR